MLVRHQSERSSARSDFGTDPAQCAKRKMSHPRPIAPPRPPMGHQGPSGPDHRLPCTLITYISLHWPSSAPQSAHLLPLRTASTHGPPISPGSPWACIYYFAYFLVPRYPMPELDPTTLHGSRGILVLENAPFTTKSPRDTPRIPQAHGRAAPRRSRSSPARLDIEDAAPLCRELRRGMGDCLGGEGAHLCPFAESASLYQRADN